MNSRHAETFTHPFEPLELLVFPFTAIIAGALGIFLPIFGITWLPLMALALPLGYLGIGPLLRHFSTDYGKRMKRCYTFVRAHVPSLFVDMIIVLSILLFGLTVVLLTILVPVDENVSILKSMGLTTIFMGPLYLTGLCLHHIVFLMAKRSAREEVIPL